jgi:peptidyl-prolyl cis-trans isomerase SurA
MLRTSVLSLFLTLVFSLSGQPVVLDKVIGIVGKQPVLLSDLQNEMVERDKQSFPVNKCLAFEMLVYQKLLVAQADHDSVTVADAEVDSELSRRMAYFINQFGTEEKLEAFYGKRINVLKDELRSDVQDQLLADKMENTITGSIKLTPAEVRLFYENMHPDSLPLIESEVELQHLVKRPAFSPEAKQEARQRIEEYRQRVVSGKSSMSTLARLYSEDPGSAARGGVMENVSRGTMVPEFDGMAFRLKKGEVSPVFETVYGFHFIELIQRKGELLDLRHILVAPKMSNEDFYKSKMALDSIYLQITSGRITFEDAVRKYSDDADTKENGGLLINNATASTRWDQDMLRMLDPERSDKIIVAINSMRVGDVSPPVQFVGTDAKPGFRLIKLKNRIDPHRANLKEDYQRIMQMATADRKKKEVAHWITQRSKTTYIKLDPEYMCKFENNWSLAR